jgi:hypothetical protein
MTIYVEARFLQEATLRREGSDGWGIAETLAARSAPGAPCPVALC